MSNTEAIGAHRGTAIAAPNIVKRLVSRRGLVLLARNTAVSVGTFLFGIVIMWVLVEEMTLNKVLSAGLSFSAATSIHYAFGRSWVFKGTTRDVAEGYGYFLVNAGVGLALTVTLFAALISWTPINYLVARVFVSALAGFAMFVLNATLNFKSL